jgi:hypothetical protein
MNDDSSLDQASLLACKRIYGSNALLEWHLQGKKQLYKIRLVPNGRVLGTGESPYQAARNAFVSKKVIWQELKKIWIIKYPLLKLGLRFL